MSTSTTKGFCQQAPSTVTHVHGHYTDIYKSTTSEPAFKVLRVMRTDSGRNVHLDSILQSPLSPIASWYTGHPNIMPQQVVDMNIIENTHQCREMQQYPGRTVQAYGYKPFQVISMPWFRHGNVVSFLRENIRCTRLPLVKDVASGLAFLHEMGVIHGNIFPNNILINIADRPTAVITDVGINVKCREKIYHHDGVIPIPHAWMFKCKEELNAALDPKSLHLEMKATMDVYSFACSVFTVRPNFDQQTLGLPPSMKMYTLRLPLAEAPDCDGDIRGLTEVIQSGHAHILKDGRPCGMNQTLWKLLQQCWDTDPISRPEMTAVVVVLRGC